MTTTLVISDLHANSTVAVCPPEFTLDDGDTHHNGDGQRWLWTHWQALYQHAEAAAKQDDLVLVLNGDIAEGDEKHRSRQLITRNRATIIRLAAELIDPLAKLAKATFVIRGTAAHAGKSGELEEAIANDLEAVGPHKGAHSWYQLPLELDGIRMDIAHKCTGGGLPWTCKTAALRLAAQAVFEYAQRGERLPHLVIRSHIHRMHDSYDAYPVRALIAPCWTLATEYIYTIAPASLADIGAFFVHTKGGEYTVWKFHPQPQKRTWQTLPSKTCCAS